MFNQNILIFILIFFIVIICVFFIYLLLCIYFLKWSGKKIYNVYNDYFNLNEYNKLSNEVLNKYGNYKVKNIYICNEPFDKFLIIFMNIYLFLINDKNNINILNKKLKHTSLIFEIEKPNDNNKFIFIDKTIILNIQLNSSKLNSNNLIKIDCYKHNYTINNILEKTLKRIGCNHFFSWKVFSRTCQTFTKEILITINKYNKYKKFYRTQKKIVKKLPFNKICIFCINIISFFMLFTNTLFGNYLKYII